MGEQGLTIVEIHETHDGSGHRVVLRGRLDTRSVPDARQSLHRIVDTTGATLRLDLGQCQIGDATALGLLVECLRRARRHGRVLLVTAADDRTQRLLRRARLASILSLDTGPGALAEPDAPVVGAGAGLLAVG